MYIVNNALKGSLLPALGKIHVIDFAQSRTQILNNERKLYINTKFYY